jgi:hypothetical protein
MTAAIRAFGDERLDHDLAAILKLPTVPEHGPPPAPTGALKALRRSRRASATIIVSLTFAAVAGTGLMLLHYTSDKQPGVANDAGSSSALVPAATIKAPAATTGPPVSLDSLPAVHGSLHRPRSPGAVLDRSAPKPDQANSAPASATPQSSSTDFAAAGDAPTESSSPPPAITPLPDASEPPPAVASNTSEAATISEQPTTSAETPLAAKRTRRDVVAAIRALRRQ